MGGHSVQRLLFAWFVNMLLLNKEQFVCKKFSENSFFKSLFLSDRKECLLLRQE